MTTTQQVREQEQLNVVRNVLLNLWHDEAVRVSLVIFLALRIVTLVATLIMVKIEPAPKPFWLNYDPLNPKSNQSGETYDLALPANAPLANIVAPWHRYDTPWYVKISIQGYKADNAIVFPPLYPALIRLFASLFGGNYVLSALVISNISCFLMFIFLFKLIQHEFPARKDGLATTAIILIAAFPTAYYLVAGYTESLFLALTLAAFLCAFQDDWVSVAILTFFATLTRLQGALLCLPFGWMFLLRYLETRRADGNTGVSRWRSTMKMIPAVAAGPLAFAGYYLYLAFNHFGSFDAAFWNEWRLTTKLPFDAIATYIQRARMGPLPEYEYNNAFILVLFTLLGIIVIFKMKPVFSLYVWSNIFIIMTRYHGGVGFPQFESIFRYALLLFPCFIVAAMLLKRWWLLAPYLLITIQWQYHLLNEFVHWRWVA